MFNLARSNKNLRVEIKNLKQKNRNLNDKNEALKAKNLNKEIHELKAKNMKFTVENKDLQEKMEFERWIWISCLVIILFGSTCFLLLKNKKKKKEDQKEEIPMSEIPGNTRIQSEEPKPEPEAGPYVNNAENYYYVDPEVENVVYDGEDEDK